MSPWKLKNIIAELEKEMATHSNILAWRIPVGRGACWATVCEATQSQIRLSV